MLLPLGADLAISGGKITNFSLKSNIIFKLSIKMLCFDVLERDSISLSSYQNFCLPNEYFQGVKKAFQGGKTTNFRLNTDIFLK